MSSSSIDTEQMYEDVRSNGAVDEPTEVSGTTPRSSRTSSRPRRSGSYESWTVVDLKKRAKEMGLTGYSGLPKDKLIDKLRAY